MFHKLSISSERLFAVVVATALVAEPLGILLAEDAADKSGERQVNVEREFQHLKDSFDSLTEKTSDFYNTRRKHNISRSSVQYFEYCLQQAQIEIVEATAETYRDRLAAAQRILNEANRLAEAFKEKKDPLAEQTGVVQRAFRSRYDGKLHPYTVFVPKHYDGTAPTPLIADLLAPGPPAALKAETLGGSALAYDRLTDSLNEKGFLAVWPPAFRRTEAEENFFDVLEEIKRDYPIDEERVFLVGVSGGGLSSWLIGLRYPDQIAAIAPVSAVTVARAGRGRKNDPVDKSRSVLYFPMNALHVPVLILHGDTDPVCPAEVQAQPMLEKMRQQGLDVQYKEYPGAGHGLGDHYYDAFDCLLAFFSDKRNVRHPKTIDFTTTSEKYSKAYWLQIDKIIAQGEFARVRAAAKDNAITIETENISQLVFIPDPNVIDLMEPVEISIDGRRVFQGVFPLRRPNTGPPRRFIRKEDGTWR